MTWEVLFFDDIHIPSHTAPAKSGMNQYEKPNILAGRVDVKWKTTEDA